MTDPRFFRNNGPLTLHDIVLLTGAVLSTGADAEKSIRDVAPLDRASAEDITFLDNIKYIAHFESSRAGACFIREKLASRAPQGMALLICEDPYRAYALTAQKFYPYIPSNEGLSPAAHIAASARIGAHTSIGPGAVIGENVMIGDHCVIGPNSVILEGVTIGSHTRIGALCSISHADIGHHCILHRGVHIGQDGFGFSMGRDGHIKVPQLGRVVIENEVEIGAGTCIDRGTGPDTTIGAGTKIDNLVQIGHNVQIGKNAVIVAQAGIAGSSRIGDGAILAGQVGIAGHVRVGAGARLAAQAGVMQDIPAGESYGGSPAVPVKEWHRQTIALKNMTKGKKVTKDHGD